MFQSFMLLSTTKCSWTVFRDRLHYLHSCNIVLDSFRTDLPSADSPVLRPPTRSCKTQCCIMPGRNARFAGKDLQCMSADAGQSGSAWQAHRLQRGQFRFAGKEQVNETLTALRWGKRFFDTSRLASFSYLMNPRASFVTDSIICIPVT